MKKLIFILLLSIGLFSCTESVETKDFSVPNNVVQQIESKRMELIKDSTFTDTILFFQVENDINYYYLYQINRNQSICLNKIDNIMPDSSMMIFFIVIVFIFGIIIGAGALKS